MGFILISHSHGLLQTPLTSPLSLGSRCYRRKHVARQGVPSSWMVGTIVHRVKRYENIARSIDSAPVELNLRQEPGQDMKDRSPSGNVLASSNECQARRVRAALRQIDGPRLVGIAARVSHGQTGPGVYESHFIVQSPHYQFTSLSWSLRERKAERLAPDLSTR
jgi:hypothetical protein